MSIRTRIWCTLLLAVVLPVGVCLYLMGQLSYDHAIRQAESVHNERARVISKSLDAHLTSRIDYVANRMAHSDHFLMLAGKSREPGFYEDLEKRRTTARNHWQEWTDRDDPRMDWFYRGPPQSFYKSILEPDYAELKDFLLVDRNGLCLAGIEKPRSFDQSQEEWVRMLRHMNVANRMMLRWEREGEHSGPRRIEILIALRDPTTKPPNVIVGGYLKVSAEFAPIFQDYLKSVLDGEFEGILTDHTGKVVAAQGIFSQFALGEVLPSEWLPQGTAQELSIVPLKVASGTQPEEQYLVSRSTLMGEEKSSDLGIYVFQGEAKESVVGPLQKTQWQLFGGAFLAMGLSAIAASIYMRQTISRPIEQLASVANELTVHTHNGHILNEEEVENLVAPLRQVTTHDEINSLADEFTKMSVKALGFQRDLEHEVEEKTRVIQDDLEMAREFQQALLPRVCPECGSTQQTDPLALELAHFYQPAAYVSGDFYDYIPIDEHRVAILIGDVMGHGARAALVTAILRALIEDVRTTHVEPAAFLSELNQRYHEIIERSGQVVFVSACYLLFDTSTGVVHGASAGHPLPLRAKSDGSGVEHLLPESKPRFPLGMMEGVQYKEACAEIAPDELILLYTDGITEAESESGQQFGEEALGAQVASHIAMHPTDLVKDVAEMVKFHAEGNVQDDVCMVAIRVLRTAA